MRFALAIVLLLVTVPALADGSPGPELPPLRSRTIAAEGHAHPAQDVDAHEKFYSTWFMPDNPARSCCNKADCYPTVIKIENGNIFARRREDGKYIYVPRHKVEQHRNNPDGRNHLCAPPPSATAYPPDTVFCFALGTGI